MSRSRPSLRIAFIGAGSVIFTRKLIGDILAFDELHDVTLALHDIDEQRLETAAAIARRAVDATGAPATVETHLHRAAAIDGAQFVINMIQVGGHEATCTDFDVPRRFGVTQTISDTIGVGGIFRALRTVPVMQDIAADMDAHAADGAWLLNYTNPMAMLTWSVYEGTPVKNVVGLCHSVQYTVRKLAQLLDVPEHEVDFRAAGVNHQAFLLDFERDGESLYPALDEAIVRDPELARRMRMRVYQAFGYFPTESSEHLAEYVPWVMHRADQIEHFRTPVDEYVRRSVENLQTYEDARAAIAGGDDLPPADPSVEYASSIIHSMVTGVPRVIYGNVRNDALIDNLPADACVEVPCLVDHNGVQPTRVGSLPPQLAALNRTFLNPVELTVRAAIEQDVRLVRAAVALDPNASATLSLDEVDELVDAMIEAHGELLPDWLRASTRAGVRHAHPV